MIANGGDKPRISFDGEREVRVPRETEFIHLTWPDVENDDPRNGVDIEAAWVKDITIRLFEDEHEERVQISFTIYDPRGGFQWELVKNKETGDLWMKVPHPDDPMLHGPLTELNPGSYRIGYSTE